MEQRREIARKYFDAFHGGRLDEVYGYFAAGGVVRYGTEPDRPAREFFPEAREFVASLEFQTHGVYTSADTGNVIIHFSFAMPDQEGAGTTEAVDIIEFDDADRITRVQVIANAPQ